MWSDYQTDRLLDLPAPIVLRNRYRPDRWRRCKTGQQTIAELTDIESGSSLVRLHLSFVGPEGDLADCPARVRELIQAKMQCVARSLLAGSLFVAMGLASCSSPTPMQRVTSPGASLLKDRIPPPDRSKYRFVRNARDWQNPYLMVRADGIDARPISASTETPTMSPAEVVTYLEKLPSIAWPYGLVVAVQENGVRAPGDGVRIERNKEELLRILEKAGVKVDLWPSA